jgi:hypothetical protein
MVQMKAAVAPHIKLPATFPATVSQLNSRFPAVFSNLVTSADTSQAPPPSFSLPSSLKSLLRRKGRLGLDGGIAKFLEGKLSC